MSNAEVDPALRYDRTVQPDAHDSLAKIAQLVEPGSTVLDLGASSGALGRYLRDDKRCIVDGVEIDPRAAASARPHYRKVLELNLETAPLRDHFPARGYDAIVCADVLEHLREPAAVLDQLPLLLADGGRLLISIPNVGYAGIIAGLLKGEFRYTPTGLLDDTHLRFFTRSSLIDLLGKHGFHARSISEVFLELRQSEFGDPPLDGLAPAVIRAVLAQPDSLTYQFIVEAVPGTGISPAALPPPVPPRFGVQLYWSRERTFAEEHSASASGLVGEEQQRIELRIPPMETAPGTLRLDVADRPGYLRLHSIEIRDQQQDLVWTWDRRPESLIAKRELVAIGDLWLSLGGDPSVELPIDEAGLARLAAGGSLALTMDWPMSTDYAYARRLLDDREQRWSREREVLMGKAEQFERQQALGRQELTALEARLEEAVGTLRATAAQAASRQDRLEYQLRTLSARLAATQKLSIGLRLRRELLPARFELDALPLHDVRDLGAGEYESTGRDPQLELRVQARRWPVGWVNLEFEVQVHEMEHEQRAVRPVLYLDSGQGYDESGKVSLPDPVGGVIRAHIWLPPTLSGIRFDPFEGEGRWRLGRLSVFELGKIRTGLRFAGPLVKGLLREPTRIPATAARAWRVFRTAGLTGIKLWLLRQDGSPKNYTAWIRQFDTLKAADRAAIKTSIARMTRRPRFSVVMPVYNTPDKLLRRAIESVQAQLYPDWELCIADDASPAPHVRRVLERAARDPRVKVIFRESNGHISAASNSALSLARGEYVALLDHDDELSEHALAIMAAEIAAHPEADLLYSDEDKIDLEGHRHDPYFKPDFNPELLWSQNFFSHLGVYRRELVLQAGGFREGFEGSQDYDLLLRCLARTAPDRIRHVPRVLYRWRTAAGSAAAEVAAKPYAFAAAQRALQEHLASLAPGARVEPGRFAGTWRVRWPLPDPAPLVSIIVPTRDAAPVLARCIDSLLDRTTYRNYELLVVDNGSREPDAVALLARLAADGRARVLRYDRPFNFSAINNFAVEQARGDVLVLLNNDTEIVDGEWLSELVSHAIRPGIGAVGARLLYPDGRVQHAGVVTGIQGVAGHAFKGLPREAPGYFSLPHLLREVSAVTGACLAVRKVAYEQVGGLDDRELQVAFNDIDFCLKLRRAGYRNLYTPWAELYHYESYSRGSDMEGARLQRFKSEIDVMRRRWPELDNDPAYNPNLSLESENYEFAAPPRAH
jgi:glycosyltransferase involved in cell wall biosynthesis/2-polyprenyl-3-methyl-5-hydroxy-6-metoxy-1,4-benzoquinol methylase